MDQWNLDDAFFSTEMEIPNSSSFLEVDLLPLHEEILSMPFNLTDDSENLLFSGDSDHIIYNSDSNEIDVTLDQIQKVGEGNESDKQNSRRVRRKVSHTKEPQKIRNYQRETFKKRGRLETRLSVANKTINELIDCIKSHEMENVHVKSALSDQQKRNERLVMLVNKMEMQVSGLKMYISSCVEPFLQQQQQQLQLDIDKYNYIINKEATDYGNLLCTENLSRYHCN